MTPETRKWRDRALRAEALGRHGDLSLRVAIGQVDAVRDGTAPAMDCPCCGRLCKLYPRSITRRMGIQLRWLVKKATPALKWVHVHTHAPPRLIKGDGEFAKLAYWDLIENKPNENDPTKRTSGVWRPTKRGVAFARGAIKVPKHAYTFIWSRGASHHVESYSDELIDIKQVLKSENRFNYTELMSVDAPAREE